MVPQVQIDKQLSASFLSQLNRQNLYFSFGGGVGDFGANLTAFAFEQQVFWIDAGVGFAGAENFGATRLLPNKDVMERFLPSFIILTHGHEDHIGAIPYLYDYLLPQTIFYLSSFTKTLLFSKFQENQQDAHKFRYVEIKKNQKIEMQNLIFYFFFLPHSIPQAFGVGIDLLQRADKTRLFYSGDFKLNGDEPRFSPKDLQNFSPVDFCFCDSTGSLSTGTAKHENELLGNFENYIANWKGRVFITVFSSHIQRIRTIVNLAHKHGRQLGILGYSIKNNLRNAFASKEFDIPMEQLRDPPNRKERSLWLVAGCQSEEGSSLYRLVRDQMQQLRLRRNDLLLFSASVIPGNDKAIFATLNLALQKGIKIVGIRQGDALLHTSGHGKTDEIAQLMDWLSPQEIIPIHGDMLHFKAFEHIVHKKDQLSILSSENIYKLNKKKIEPEKNLGCLNDNFIWVEQGEVHLDTFLFNQRAELSKHGVCTLVLQKSEKKIVSLSYVGVVSSAKLNADYPIVKKELEYLIEYFYSSAQNLKEKKLREKIDKIHLNHFKKSPWLQLVWI